MVDKEATDGGSWDNGWALGAKVTLDVDLFRNTSADDGTSFVDIIALHSFLSELQLRLLQPRAHCTIHLQVTLRLRSRVLLQSFRRSQAARKRPELALRKPPTRDFLPWSEPDPSGAQSPLKDGSSHLSRFARDR